MAQQRYNGIDGLRAYAAIAIVIMHVITNIAIYPTQNYLTKELIPWCTNLTFLFMLVSAFSVCCGYYDRFKSGQITPNKFYSRRYQRILPFFALLCIIDFALTPTKEQLYQLFANITLCFNLIPGQHITMIGVGWFIGIVFVFYLLFPFFVFMMDNRRRAWFSTLIVVAMAWVVTDYSFNDTIPTPIAGKTHIVYSMPLFMAGGIIFLYRDVIVRFLTSINNYVRLLFVIGITILYFCFPQLQKGSFYVLISETILFSVFLCYAISSNGTVLSNRITKFLSNISLEIYLCHMLVFRVVEKLHLEQYITNADWCYIITCMVVIAGAVAFAHCYKIAEKRILKLI